jgi:hypothetical protein
MDDLRANLVRMLAYENTGAHCTECEYIAAYNAACASLRARGWLYI